MPKHITRISLGILKYSTVRAKTKLLGGIIQVSDFFSTKPSKLKFLGSTIVLLTLLLDYYNKLKYYDKTIRNIIIVLW